MLRLFSNETAAYALSALAIGCSGSGRGDEPAGGGAGVGGAAPVAGSASGGLAGSASASGGGGGAPASAGSGGATASGGVAGTTPGVGGASGSGSSGAPSQGGAGTGGASGGLPPLTVQGPELKDPAGKSIVLRGSSLIDIGALYWYGGKSAAGITTRMDQVAAAGIQGHVVRLPVYPTINYNPGGPQRALRFPIRSDRVRVRRARRTPR